MNTPAAPLVDRFGRRFPYLRLSLTEACNFKCSYCLPDGYTPCGSHDFLRIDEIRRLLSGFAAVGLRKVRLTGGEPSLRRDLTDIIRAVAEVPSIEKIAMTTNGCLLHKRADEWRAAGLTALNISLDSLDAQRFEAITGYRHHAQLLGSIEHCLGLGFDALKLNAVLLRGLNDGDLGIWLDYLRERPIGLRFIELMQTGDNTEYFKRHHLSAESIEQPLREAGWRQLPRAADAGPAREYSHPDYAGRIGIIAPYSKDFCANCNRLRVTARGDLRLCLFGEFGIALRPLLQDDADRESLIGRLTGQLTLKTASHRLHEGMTGITPHLASIGG